MANTFRVNWHLTGLLEKELAAGEVVELEGDKLELAQALVSAGVLTAIDDVEDSQTVDLSKLTKAKLVEHAAKYLGLTLSAADMSKDAMLSEIAAIQAKA